MPASDTFETRLDQRSSIDNRPCLELFDFGHTRESSEQVVGALTRFGKSCFVDARKRSQDRFSTSEPAD